MRLRLSLFPVLYSLLFCCMFNFSFAQKKQIDSLKILISTAKHDTTRIKNLIEWGHLVSDYNLDSAIIIFKQAKKLVQNNLIHLTASSSKRLRHVVRRYNGISYYNIGYMYFLKNEIEIASKEFKEAIKIRELVAAECAANELFDSKSLLARACHGFGEFNRRIGNFDDALKYGTQALSTRLELSKTKLTPDQVAENKKGIAGLYTNLSAVYGNKGEEKKAIELELKSLKINIELKNNNGIAKSYSNLSASYGRMAQRAKQLEYLQKSIKLLELTEDKIGLVKAFRDLGSYYLEIGKTDKALQSFLKSLKDSREMNNLENIAGTLLNLGGLYHDKGEKEKALSCYHESLSIRIKMKNKLGIAHAHGNIARYHQSEGNIKEALKEYQFTLKSLEEIGDLSGACIALNNMGNIYSQQGLPQEALKNYEKCLKIYEKLEDKYGTAMILGNMAVVFELQNNLKKALIYNKKSLQYYTETNNQYGTAQSLTNMASINGKVGDADTAIIMYEKALKIYENLDDKIGIVTASIGLADLYFKLGNIPPAKKLAEKGFAISKQLGYPIEIKKSSLLLRDIYQTSGNSKKSLEMFELYVLMRDSIGNEESKKNSIKTQLKYEYDKKTAADSVKNIELQKVKDAQLLAQSASLKQEKTQRYALYGGLVLIIGFLGFVFNRFRVTNKQKKIIENQKQLVDDAFNKLHEKNQEVMDSIHYAKRIQTALITSEHYMLKVLNKLKTN